MAKASTLLEEIRGLIEEGELQLHLMNMDLKDDWQALVGKFHHLEQQISKSMENLGKQEEAYFVGEEEDIRDLLKDFKEHKQKHESNKSTGA